MRHILRIVAVLFAILVLVVVVAPFVIPVNQFRPTIESKASQTVGRQVKVGNLSLSILGGSLVADNLAIADDPKFNNSPFLTAKSVKVGVKLMPLVLSKTLDVTDISIENPQVTLIRNPSGQWNYSSLGTSAAQSQVKQEPPTNQPSSHSARSSPEVSVGKLELKNGRVIIGSTNSAKRSVYDAVNIVASDVSASSKSPVAVSADLPGGGKLKLDGTVGPLNAADTDLTPMNAKLTVTSLNLASTGFVDSSKGLGGLLDLDATLTSQNGQAETKGSAKLSKALLVAGGEAALVPVSVDFNSRYDLAKNAGMLEPSILKIGSAAAHLSGTYQVPDQATVNIKVDGENMPAKDLEAFLPAIGIHIPKGANLEAGTFSTNLGLAGPTNNLVTTGNVTLSAAKLAGFDLGSKLHTISALTGVKTGNDLEIEKMTTDMRVAPDSVRADNFNAIVPALGTLVGAGTIDSKNSLDFKMAATLNGNVGNLASAPSNLAASAIGGLIGRATGAANPAGCKGTQAVIPFQIKGTTSDPQFVPDVGGIAANMLKSQLGCASALLPGASQAQRNNSKNALGTLGDLLKKP